jgi:nucleoside-diphosphate-sugar epimerase
MRVLIIGGTRFIGPFVVRRLQAMGHAATLFHRGQTPADDSTGASEILGDRRDLDAFAAAFHQAAPDVVLDMIPITPQDARDVVRVFSGIAKRLVVLSSLDVYRAYGRMIGIERGRLEPVPLGETARLRGVRFPYRAQLEPGDRLYDYDKILVEETAMGQLDCPATILRLPMVYGPGDYQHRLRPYLERMDDGRREILLDAGTAAWRCSRSYVENVAGPVALAVTEPRAAGRTYNVAEPVALSEAEWVAAIGTAAGWTGRIIVLPVDDIPAHLAPQVDTRQALIADAGRIHRELGFRETVDRETALRRTVAWERAHPTPGAKIEKVDYAAEDAAISRGRIVSSLLVG